MNVLLVDYFSFFCQAYRRLIERVRALIELSIGCGLRVYRARERETGDPVFFFGCDEALLLCNQQGGHIDLYN